MTKPQMLSVFLHVDDDILKVFDPFLWKGISLFSRDNYVQMFLWT